MKKIKTYFLSLIGSGFLGAVFFPGTGSVDQTVDFVTINGAIICEADHLINFKAIRVDIYDGNQLKGSTDLDEYGRFSKRYEAKIGKHLIILFNKSSSKAIDRNEFTSNRHNREFNINFKECDVPKN